MRFHVNCQQVSTEYFWNSELALVPSKYMRDPSNPGRSWYFSLHLLSTYILDTYLQLLYVHTQSQYQVSKCIRTPFAVSPLYDTGGTTVRY
jgi:hypothetical protein